MRLQVENIAIQASPTASSYCYSACLFDCLQSLSSDDDAAFTEVSLSVLADFPCSCYWWWWGADGGGVVQVQVFKRSNLCLPRWASHYAHPATPTSLLIPLPMLMLMLLQELLCKHPLAQARPLHCKHHGSPPGCLFQKIYY